MTRGTERTPTRPVRIIYVARFATGGSVISLKTLVCNLDRARFEPRVLFHRVGDPTVYRELEAEGIPVHVLSESATAARECDILETPAASVALDTPSDGEPAEGTRRPSVRDWLEAGALRRRILPGYHLYRSLRAYYRSERPLRTRLRQFLEAHDADLVHVNTGLRMHVADLFEVRRLGIPAVCHVRQFQRLTAVERRAARGVRRFLYISRAIEENYESQGIDPKRGEVVHNVAVLPAPLDEAERNAVRAEFGWSGDRFVVINVGRLVSWKGQDVFLRSLSTLRASHPHVAALIVGEAEDAARSRDYARSLRELAADAGFAGDVVFTGLRRDVEKLMGAADVVVHSATAPEPFGRVIIEGMAAGTPVVASRDGGVLDIIDDGENGILTAPGDSDELATALRRIADDAVLRARLGEAGRRRVEQDFSVERQVQRIQEIYEQCLTAEGVER